MSDIYLQKETIQALIRARGIGKSYLYKAKGKTNMSDIDLQKETIQALIRAKGTWPRIVLDCDVSHSWLSKVVRGEIPNPRYRLLKKVRDYLLSQDSGQHDQETH